MEDCQFQINMFKTGNFFNVLGNFRFFHREQFVLSIFCNHRIYIQKHELL